MTNSGRGAEDISLVHPCRSISAPVSRQPYPLSVAPIHKNDFGFVVRWRLKLAFVCECLRPLLSVMIKTLQEPHWNNDQTLLLSVPLQPSVVALHGLPTRRPSSHHLLLFSRRFSMTATSIVDLRLHVLHVECYKPFAPAATQTQKMHQQSSLEGHPSRRGEDVVCDEERFARRRGRRRFGCILTPALSTDFLRQKRRSQLESSREKDTPPPPPIAEHETSQEIDFKQVSIECPEWRQNQADRVRRPGELGDESPGTDVSSPSTAAD